MRNALIAATAVIFSASAAPALAQLQEIVVTGSRIGGEDYSSIPAVVLSIASECKVEVSGLAK
jgi:hypothetical protein